MSGLLTSITEAAIPFAALVVDTVYGDPRSKWHPVVLIGNLISFYESHLYPEKKTSDGNMFLRGMMTVLLVLLTVGLLTAFLIYLGHLGGLWFYAAISTIVLYFTMTPRSLARDGLEIYHLLKDDKDLVTARKRLSWIVGRDTENLDESNIARGISDAYYPELAGILFQLAHHFSALLFSAFRSGRSDGLSRRKYDGLYARL